MPNQKVNGSCSHHYASVLEDLGRRLEYHKLECQRLRTLMENLSSFQADIEHTASNSHDDEPSGQLFAGLTALEAIAKFIEKKGTPQASGSIIAGLRQGGFETKSRDLSMIVYPVLSRHWRETKDTRHSVIEKFGSEWGLSKWKRNWVVRG